MSIIELKVPDIGNVADVEVIEVLISAGESVEAEQTLVVMESDKASMDLPSPASGKIVEVKVKVGDNVSEGSIIATLEESDADSSSETETQPAESAPEQAVEKTPEATEQKTAEPEPAAPTPQPTTVPAPAVSTDSGSAAHASPTVRRLARELGIDINAINTGSGRKGRILKDDIKNYVKQALSSGAGASGSGIPPIPAVDFSKFGEFESRPLNKIKRLTGQGMTRAWLNTPMVTQHNEADITDLEAFRQNLNAEQVKKNTGIKITPLVFIIKALIGAMKQFPQFNTSLTPDGKELIYKNYFNIGIAVDTPNGLVVPVIKAADQKSVFELSAEMAEISKKARDGKLMPADMQGGCMTISSLGGIGGTAFTPIVNAPEVAILGVSRSSMKPIWNGSEFEPRLILPIDLTYDHRVIDGADGARFTVALAEYLSDLRRLIL